MPTVTLSPVFKQKFFGNDGRPLNGGKLFSYLATTSTKTATYTDSTGATPNANPIILNYRGEADVWIEPNKGFKFVLAPATDTDPPTNPIWTLDNVKNSQLLTLYGGIDSGVVNAYVLNFTANFTAYTDGIVIYWIPSNSNTGASTINVNGLGPVPIINQDGSALSAGQLLANQVAVIMYQGAGFQLISSGLASNASQTLFIARRSTASGNQTLTNNATTTVIFPTEDVDQGANYNPATGIYTVSVPGVYTFSAQILVQGNANAAQTYGPYYFSKNNNSALPGYIALSGFFRQELNSGGGIPASALGAFNGTATFQLSLGDTVRIRCQQPNNSGGAFSILALDGYNNFTGYKCA